MPTGARLVPFAFAMLVGLMLLNGLATVFPALVPLADFFTRPNERSVIEFAEALLWLSASVGFGFMTFRELRSSGLTLRALTSAAFTVLAFLVCGEEISWGQHLGLFDASETVIEVNAQNEFNFHNTDVSRLLGLSPDHPLYARLSNFGNLVSPIFQLFCVTVWGIAPLLLPRLVMSRSRGRAWYPIPSRPVSVFIIVSFVAYLVVDQLLFDVAEIVEVCIALTALLVVLDNREAHRAPAGAIGEPTR